MVDSAEISLICDTGLNLVLLYYNLLLSLFSCSVLPVVLSGLLLVER